MALLRNSRLDESGTLVKCIALNGETMKPRLVLKAIRGQADQCTLQEVYKDDVVIMTTHLPERIVTDVLIVTKVNRYKTFMSNITGSELHMSATMNWMGVFETTDSPLRDWLLNIDTNLLLPKDYGWDGKHTRYEKEKLEEFKELLLEVDCDLKDDIIAWAMVSPRENVNHQWTTAQAIPRDSIYLPPFKNVAFHFVILWKEDGVVFECYDDKDYSVEPLDVTSLRDDSVKRAMVCTVLSNKYGRNLRWKLYK